MAKIDTTNTSVNLSSNHKLPQDRYLCQCIEEKFAPSQKGNPMITREWQIVAPETVEINGQQVVVAGTRYLQEYLTVIVMNGNERDVEATKKAQDRLVENFRKLGFDADNIDDENPLAAGSAKGKFADFILGADEQERRKEPTPAQKAAGQPGSLIKDANGKDIITYRPKIVQLLGAAEKPSNVAF